MPCLECGGKMEMVGEREVNMGDEGYIVEIFYECPWCGNEIVVLDAE